MNLDNIYVDEYDAHYKDIDVVIEKTISTYCLQFIKTILSKKNTI